MLERRRAEELARELVCNWCMNGHCSIGRYCKTYLIVQEREKQRAALLEKQTLKLQADLAQAQSQARLPAPGAETAAAPTTRMSGTVCS